MELTEESIRQRREQHSQAAAAAAAAGGNGDGWVVVGDRQTAAADPLALEELAGRAMAEVAESKASPEEYGDDGAAAAGPRVVLTKESARQRLTERLHRLRSHAHSGVTPEPRGGAPPAGAVVVPPRRRISSLRRWLRHSLGSKR